MIFPLKNRQRSSVKRRSDTSVVREERAILIEWIHFFVGLSASSVRTRKRVACERIRHKIKGLSKNSSETTGEMKSGAERRVRVSSLHLRERCFKF